MTYAYFLIIFLGIPLLIAIGVTWLDYRQGRSLPRELRNLPAWIAILAHVLIAVIYTTLWDNHLVATRVWYYNPSLVAGIILGWVPIEEYTFFVLQTLLTGLWLVILARRLPFRNGHLQNNHSFQLVASLVLSMIFAAALTSLLSGSKPGTYLSLILVWSIPPVILQVIFGADILRRHWRLVLISILSVTIYLSLTDSLAISAGTWTIDPKQSLNIFLGGKLPLEEFTFFLMTNVLIVNGVVLALAVESRSRARDLLQSLSKSTSYIKETIKL